MPPRFHATLSRTTVLPAATIHTAAIAALFLTLILSGCGDSKKGGSTDTTTDLPSDTTSMDMPADNTADGTPDTSPDMTSACAGIVCQNGGTCVETAGVGACECPMGTAGDNCELTGGCGANPCFAGVACTDAAGMTPNFTCGDCPMGFSGDGITCTEDIEPPMVVSTVPAQGETIVFDSSGIGGTINRLIINFDRDVLEINILPLVLTASANHVGSDFVQDLEVRMRTGGADMRQLTLDSTGAAYSTFPDGDYEITINNVRSAEGGTLATYTWGFTAEGCGDGTCSASESQCTCAVDCGACAGCCASTGGIPASECRGGMANDSCGANGSTCGVCIAPDVCVNGMGCL